MPAYVVEVSYHHNSDKSGYKNVLDIPEGDDPRVRAIVRAICDEFCLEEVDPVLVAEALAEVSRSGVTKLVLPSACPGYEDFEYKIWRTGDISYGIGEGSAFASVWVSVKPYRPNPVVLERLEKFDREQLIDLLLRVDAAGKLDL